MSSADVNFEKQVDRYVRRKMCAAEQDEFELAFFDDPELLARVEAALALREALDAANTERAVKTRSAGRGLWIFSPAWSIAATCGAGLMAVLLLVERIPGIDTPASQQLVVERQVLLSGAYRSTGPGTTPELDGVEWLSGSAEIPFTASGLVMFEVPLPAQWRDAGAEARLAMRLTHAGGNTVYDATVTPLRGYALVLVPATSLRAGTYVLTLGTGDEVVTRHRIVVHPPDPRPPETSGSQAS